MNILIGADLVPTKSNIDLFASGDVQELLGEELFSVLRNADYRIFNLEVPLTDQEHPIPKCGPNLIAPTKCVAGYKAMQADLLTLANNHILDQDQQGLASTCRVLDAAGVAYTGVGQTPEEAAKPYIFECDGKKIGVYACAEHEFSIGTEYSAGANPIDLLESPDHVAALKEQCDYVIVLYHGGKEHYRYPSPNLQKVCRKLVEKGADLVVCQHSHCIGCEEKYQGGTIVYGQGNFLFDGSESEFWQTSLLVRIGDDFGISYIPLKKNGNGVRLAGIQESKEIMAAFQRRSIECLDSDIMKAKFEEVVHQSICAYLLDLCGMDRTLFLRVINKLSNNRFYDWYIKKRYTLQKRKNVINHTECETHNEILLYGLKNWR